MHTVKAEVDQSNDLEPASSSPNAEANRQGTVQALPAAEKINASYVRQVLRLNLLAPDIIEAILDGRQPAFAGMIVSASAATPSGAGLWCDGSWPWTPRRPWMQSLIPLRTPVR